MQKPAFIATEKKPEESALIIDKVGVIGEALSKKLSHELLTVLVSRRLGLLKNQSENIILLPYKDRLPSIPDHPYSYIFVVDDKTRATRSLLPKFIEKAERDNSQFILLTHISEINQKSILPILNSLSTGKYGSGRVKALIYGDIFSREKPYDFAASEFVVNKFITQAQRFGLIEVEGNGLKKTYPVFLDDVLSGVLEVVFGESDRVLDSRDLPFVFFLFPKHPPTQISLAHMIQKANPSINVDFIKEKTKDQNNIVLPSVGKYLLNDNYQLNERIKKIFIGGKEGYFVDKDTQYFPIEKNSYNFLPLTIFLYLIFILFLPLLTTLFFSFLGFKILTVTKGEVDRGELINAEKLINFSRTYFNIAEKSSKPLLIEARIIGKEDSLKSMVKDIVVGEDTSIAGLYMIDGLKKYSGVFTNQSKNPNKDFLDATTMLKSSILILQKIQAEDKLLLNVNKAIKDIEPVIKFASGATDILPSIFGFSGTKTYLILFQDNMELRPSGGVIGSYGLLTMDKGRVLDFSVHNTYDADSKLKGHVEPPYPIRRYLPTIHWYLRDSNFDIDFVKSASKSAFFLQVETGKKVDGVIGIDMSFVKGLLSAVGPTYLPNYKKTVDEKNFFELRESNKEGDFIKSVFSAIFLDLSSTKKKKLPYLSLAKVVSDSLLQKHLLFAHSVSSIQDFFTVNNWSGSLWRAPSGAPLWDKRLETMEAINDFVGINEANLGGNKANYFVKRKVSKNIAIDNKGKISGELSIFYDNKDSVKGSERDYKNYLRIILQKDVELSSVIIDEEPQSIVKAITDPQVYEAKKFTSPIGLEVEKTEEENKTVYGFFVNIPAGELKTIKTRYTYSKKANLSASSFFYNLYILKQPGAYEYPFDFSLSFPPGYRIIDGERFMEKAGAGTNGQGKIYISKILYTDDNIDIRLAKQ